MCHYLTTMDNMDSIDAIEYGETTLTLPGIGEPERNKIKAKIQEIKNSDPELCDRYEPEFDPMREIQFICFAN